AAKAAVDKLGTDLVAYDVSEQLAITDVFLVVTASNERQVGAVVDGIEESLRGHDAKPVRREGYREQRWVLLDYLDIVVHVQLTDERRFYAIRQRPIPTSTRSFSRTNARRTTTHSPGQLHAHRSRQRATWKKFPRGSQPVSWRF